MSNLSYGTSLPDSETLVNERLKNNFIEFLPTVANFVAARANLDREYGTKLSQITGKAREQAIKEGGNSTLSSAWNQIIEASSWDYRHHLALSDSLTKEIVEPLVSNAAKFEGIRKKQHHFAAALLTERDRAVGEYEKSKQKYFDSCEAVELSRQKKGLAKDPKSTEKLTKSFDLAMIDMEIAKNQFLLDTDTANVVKSRLYTTDLPALHDDFQLIETATVRQLVDLLAKLSDIAEATFERRQSALQLAHTARISINVEEDQRKFIDTFSPNILRSFSLPRDLEFEPCPIWNDVGEMSVTPSSINFLQNVKNKATSRLTTITPSIDSKKREVDGLRNLRIAYEKDRSLGDASAVLENLLESVRATSLLEIESTELKSQIELINLTIPDDQPLTSRLHDLKSTSFVTPTSCIVCESTVWGKGLTCKQCGVNLHSKCELKISPGCGTAARAEVKRSGSGRSSIGVSPVSSINSRNSAPISPVAGRKVPPAFGAAIIPVGSSQDVEKPIEVQRSAVVLYDYQATNAFELTVEEGEAVVVVEDEDESGWSKITTLDGRRGQVPASYLQINDESAEAEEEESTAEEVKSDVKRVIALYDYTSQSDEELSAIEGEYFDLTAVGMEFGEGWIECIKDGKVGLLPSTYVELC